MIPLGIISLDEQRLIQAVVGGYQDRVDDARAFTGKLELLLTGVGLPETDAQGNPVNNAVIAQVQSPKGVVYNRSLEIQDDTPAAGDPALLSWVAGQLQLDDEHVLLSAAYGVDPLRLVDANILGYLAETVGAVLWRTAAQDPDQANSDALRLIQTWFPRLQFKGTAQSFETLGRLLGFDDVRMTPLWSRLSPRVPNDIGAPANAPDFALLPDFYPKQTSDNFYDPWDLTDGPFYTWTGTASAQFGTNDSRFYPQAINGFSPFIVVNVLGTAPADPDPALSPYILVGGGPENAAFVNPSGTGLQFQAISPGASFNGMAVQVQSFAGGEQRLLTVTERLSAIKYRSSYYDLAMTVDFDGPAVAQFGTNVAQPSPDLEADPTGANLGAAAQSPYRPWTSGSLTQEICARDWVSEIDPASSQVVVQARVQAGLSDRELNVTELIAAGVQLVQAMEEVRPATRQARTVSAGYLIRDQVGYADYDTSAVLLTTLPGVFTYYGVLAGYPAPPYAVEFDLLNVQSVLTTWASVPGVTYQIWVTAGPDYGQVVGSVTATGTLTTFPVPFSGALVNYGPTLNGQLLPILNQQVSAADYSVSGQTSPTDPGLVNLSTVVGFTGTFNYADASYELSAAPGYDQFGVLFVANWQPTSTEVVRANPTSAEPTAYQVRPEDQLDPPIMDLADEYPWRRDEVGGGELVDFATYLPPTPDVETVPLGRSVAVFDQTGAQYEVTLSQSGTWPPGFAAQPRSVSPYVPGQPAIAFTGTFISLDQVVNPVDLMDYAFKPGWQLYHFGLVQGVLVADAPKFFGAHHRDGLALWLPLNETPRDALALVDHSSYGTNPGLTGLGPEDRQFDATRGWFLAGQPGLQVLDSAARGVAQSGELACGFWFRAAQPFSGEQVFLSAGPLAVSLQTIAHAPVVTVYANQVSVVQFDIDETWSYLGLSLLGLCLTAYCWNAAGVFQQAAFTLSSPVSVVDYFALALPVTGVDLQDIRLWNTSKTQAELDLAHYHQPTPTAVLYRPAYLLSANNYDRYGVRVLPSGLVTPDLMPSSVQTPSAAWVSRYDSTGQYDGQSRFKEVGVGGGNAPPPVQRLGAVWNTMTGAGTTVVSTWGPGAFVGINAAWTNDNPPPDALELAQLGGSSGTVATSFNTGTSAPWPNPLESTNPCRDRIWVQGDDHFLWEVTAATGASGGYYLAAEKIFRARSDAELQLTGTFLSEAPILQLVSSFGNANGAYFFQGTTSSGTIFPGQLLVQTGTSSTTDNGQWAILPSGQILRGQVLPSAGTYFVETTGPANLKVYHPSSLIYAEEPTGAEVSLTSAVYGNQLRVSAAGQVYAAPYSGTVTSAPIYLYGNQQAVVDLAGTAAFNAWTSPNAFGLAQSPPVAALPGAGEISFEVTTAGGLVAGNYQLVVTSGNIGQADAGFPGFQVVVTVGEVVFPATLCAGQAGANFQATDTFNLTLPRSLPASPSSWLLSFDWLNPYVNAQRGTARQLAISAVSLIWLSPALYEISLTAEGTSMAPVSTASADFPATPGGWFAAITSWGTVANYTHESSIYPANDTFVSQQPVSNLLTGNTAERREDIILNGSYYTTDPALPSLPSYTSIVVT
jgi:hypothetical protein